MAFYMDEEQVWKCLKHPSKRRRTGICPTCLHERLVTLCPECANTRPCSCYQVPLNSTSASSSSRVSTLIESEPAFRKSRSLAIPILHSISKHVDKKPLPNVIRSKISFLSVFKASKTKKCDLHVEEVVESSRSANSGAREDNSTMMRSRSVAVGVGDSFGPTTTKHRGWYLPSPMKVFRQSKDNY